MLYSLCSPGLAYFIILLLCIYIIYIPFFSPLSLITLLYHHFFLLLYITLCNSIIKIVFIHNNWKIIARYFLYDKIRFNIGCCLFINCMFMHNLAFFSVATPAKKVTKTNEKHKKTTSDYHRPFSVMHNYARNYA